MKYKLNKNLINQIIDNKMTIFDGEKSVLYTFNETASFIFSEIKKKTDTEELIKLMIKKYKIDAKLAKKDLDEIIHDLISKKIILK